jgi:hypothetical protein
VCLEPPNPPADRDDALLEHLGELLREHDPVPEDLKAAMRAAFATRTHPAPTGERPRPTIRGEHR